MVPLHLREARHRWREQRNTAKQRGIPWQFPFPDWCRWWEDQLGPDWLQARGRGASKFCMARKGDQGPYSPENVYCTTFSGNVKDARIGARSGHRKLTDAQAIDIFTAHGCKWVIARSHGVSYDTVSNIRTGRGWSRVTAGQQRGQDCDCYKHKGAARRCRY